MSQETGTPAETGVARLLDAKSNVPMLVRVLDSFLFADMCTSVSYAGRIVVADVAPAGAAASQGFRISTGMLEKVFRSCH